MRKYRLNGRSRLPQVTSTVEVWSGLGFLIHPWAPNVFYTHLPPVNTICLRGNSSRGTLPALLEHVYTAIQVSRACKVENLPRHVCGEVSENLLDSCVQGPEAPVTIMVGTRSIQSSGCPRALPSSCHSKLSKGARRGLGLCQAWPALGRTQKLSANN